jgi:hypothetical protein
MWRMCFLCWLSKATNTYSEYDKCIAFPRQQWKSLYQRVAVIRNTYITCLVMNSDTPSQYSHVTMFPIRIQSSPVHPNTQHLPKRDTKYGLLIFPYLHKFLGQCSCPYMSRASHRPWYTALNLHRASASRCK